MIAFFVFVIFVFFFSYGCARQHRLVREQDLLGFEWRSLSEDGR
jgi:hypothetical protein